jgi:predicted Zn-dependent peptidase
MVFWQHIWLRLRAVPAGIWAALGVALTILGLYMRGKRLQGELAQARVAEDAAKAAFVGAKDLGKAMVHIDAAEQHAAKAEAIQKMIDTIEKSGVDEQKRLHALPASKIPREYLKSLQGKKPN